MNYCFECQQMVTVGFNKNGHYCENCGKAWRSTMKGSYMEESQAKKAARYYRTIYKHVHVLDCAVYARIKKSN